MRTHPCPPKGKYPPQPSQREGERRGGVWTYEGVRGGVRGVRGVETIPEEEGEEKREEKREKS